MDLYGNLDIAQAVIYCNTKKTAIELGEKMKKHDFAPSIIHDETPELKVKEIMRELRTGATRLLITNCEFPRGTCIQHLALAINYDIPYKKDVYMQRIS